MRFINHPVLCNYYVTYRCNASCGFCDIWEKPSPYVTLENVHQNLRDLKKLGVRVICPWLASPAKHLSFIFRNCLHDDARHLMYSLS